MEKNKRTIGFHFGALVPKLEDQLKEQGITPDKTFHHFQKDADAITRLHIRGILTESFVNVARNKLLRNIIRHLEKEVKDHAKENKQE